MMKRTLSAILITAVLSVIKVFAFPVLSTEITSVQSDSVFDPEHPIEYLADGRTETDAKFISGSVSGDFILNLPEAARIVGLALRGSKSDEVIFLNAEYERNGAWVPFLGASVIPLSFDRGEKKIDLSYDGARAEKIRCSFRGNLDALSISSVVVRTESLKTQIRPIEPDSVSSTDNISYYSSEHDLFDGNPETFWLGEQDTAWEKVHWFVHKFVSSRRNYLRSHHGWQEGSVTADLKDTAYVESIRLYSGAHASGIYTIEVKRGWHWSTVVSMKKAEDTGWLSFGVDRTIDAVRLTVWAEDRHDEFGGFGELEIWGRTDEEPDSLTRSWALIDTPEGAGMGSFYWDGDWGKYANAQVSYACDSEIPSIDINGTLIAPVATSKSTDAVIAEYPVPFARLEDDSPDNFFAIMPNADGSVSNAKAFVMQVPGYGAPFGPNGVFGDGSLDTSPEGESEVELSFQNPVFIKEIAPYSDNLMVYGMSAFSGSVWEPLHINQSGVYEKSIAASKLKLEGNVSTLNELMIWGSLAKTHDLEVSVLYPVPGSVYKTENYGYEALYGEVSDPDAKVTVNDVKTVRYGKYFWVSMKDLKLDDDENPEVKVCAVSSDGRTKTITESWYVENKAYKLALVDEGTVYVRSDTYTIRGTASRLFSSVFINGEKASFRLSEFSGTVSLKSGLNIIPVIQKSNITGKIVNSRGVRIYRITDAVNVTVTSHPMNFTTQSRSIVLKGTVRGIAPLSVTVNGKRASVTGSYWVGPLTSLRDGANTIVVKATDKSGESATVSLSISSDGTLPGLEIISPVAGNEYHGTPVTIQGTTSDASTVRVFVNGTIAHQDGNDFTLPVDFPDGTNTINVYAIDAAGNKSNVNIVQFIADSTPPREFPVSLDPSGWTNVTTATASFLATDETTGIARYEAAINQDDFTEVTSPWTIVIPHEGIHNVFVKAYDRVGNMRVCVNKLYVDWTPPLAVEELRLIPGKDRMETLWTTPDDDVIYYHVIRTVDDETASFDTTSMLLSDENLEPGTMIQYSIQPVDKGGNLGPWVTADSAVVGVAISSISTVSTEPVLVEFANIKMAVTPSSLPADVKAVLINEIESEDLEAKSVNPIIGPIYSFTSLSDDGTGNLVETTHTEFENEVMVFLDYDESLLPNGFPESNLGVYYYDTLWSRWFRVEKAAIDIEQNKILFLTNHFTDFSVQPTLLQDLKPQELKDAGHSPFKSESRAGEVTVSPQGGTMMTEVTEFVLKGKNGFSYPVKRIYDTQTARVDSPSINLNLTIGLNFGLGSLSIPAQIADELVKTGENFTSGQITNKLMDMFRKNGDYPLAMGIGWRLSFPYVLANDTSVMVRLPSGGYYAINQMELQGEAPLVSGIRTLTFENHRGDDFTFRVHQVRGDLTGTITGLASDGEKLKKALKDILIGEYGENKITVGMLGNLIPGWITFSSELITKDGTYYFFDGLGRVVKISDPSGTNVIEFQYNGFILSKITDPVGNITTFEYDDPVFSGIFLRPSIKKITTPGPGGTTRSSSFEYDTSDIQSTLFLTLPPMKAASDVGGRKTSYEQDVRFLFSGGGSAKINFLALLLDFIPGVSVIKDLIGFNSLTISGHINIEWPRLIKRIDAPERGITEISYLNKDLSGLYARPADFFFGVEWLPTALEISYEFLYRLLTDSVTVRNGPLSKTTTYGYTFAPRESQWIVERSVINDGLTLVTQTYSIYSRRYYRYISVDDTAIAAMKQGIFTRQSNLETEYFPLATSVVTAAAATGTTYESQSTVWDTVRSVPLTQTFSRGPSFRKIVSHSYDNWGNETATTTTQTTPQGTTSLTVQSWYWGTSSTAPQGVPGGIPATTPQVQPGTMGLLLGSVTTASRPEPYFGSQTDVVYRGYAYDDSGRQVWQGLWTGDHWAGSTWTYYPVTADHDRLSGLVKETVSAVGQKTGYIYDFTSKRNGNLWIETKTYFTVKDVWDRAADVVEETAFDWGTGWPRFSKNPEGFVTETSYDALGRPTGIVKPGDEAASESGTWPTSRSNAPWDRITYNDTDRTSTVYRDMASGTSAAPKPDLLPAEVYEYDARGNLVKIDKYERSGTSPQVSTTRLGYDAYNRVTSMTDPRAMTTTYSYDYLSRPAGTVYADGSSMGIVYDDASGIRDTTNERGFITREHLNWNGLTEVSIADFGRLKITTRMYYDGLDRINIVLDAENQVTSTRYSAFGQPSVIIRPSLSTYASPMMVSDTIPVITVVSVQPMEIVQYDDAGRPVTRKTGYEGHWRTVTTMYDGLGRAIKENADGRQTWTWYNGSGRPVRLADGEQVLVLDAASRSTELDATGARFTRIAYTSRGQEASRTDPSGATVTYEYDRDDRRTLMRDPRAKGDRIEDFSIHYSFDDFGRLIQADLPPVMGSSRRTVSFVYDLRGNPVLQNDPDGKATAWTYDRRNRKTSQSMKGTDGLTVVSAWGYDAAGNVVKEIEVSTFNESAPELSYGIVTEKQYDALNRLTLISMPDGQKLSTVYDGLGRTIETRDARDNVTGYSYNSLNKLIESREPLGKVTRYICNVWGDATVTTMDGAESGPQVWVRGFNAWSQTVWELNNAGQSRSYGYDMRGLLTSSRDPNGTTVVTSYSLTGLPVLSTYENGDQLYSTSWSYDEAGSLVSARDGTVTTHVNTDNGSYSADPYSLVYQYDTTVNDKKLSWSADYDTGLRPTGLTYPDSDSISLTYNGLGLLTSIPGYASDGTYDFRGRLTQLNAANTTGRTKSWNSSTGNLDGYHWTGTGKASRSLQWDNRGNLYAITRDGYQGIYNYDALNRLEYSMEAWPIEVSTKNDSGVYYGVRERDVAGDKSLNISQTQSSVRFDYNAGSIGLDLGSIHDINRVRFTRIGDRVSQRTVEVFVSTLGLDGSWTKVSTWLVTDQEGSTILFDKAVRGKYLKVHSLWDERDADNEPIDRSTVSGTPEELIEVWCTVDGQTISYDYDSLGNRLSESRFRGTTVVTDSEYYAFTNRVKSDGQWSYNYDTNGNLIERGTAGTWNAAKTAFDWDSGTGLLWKYTYDLKNRLVEVSYGKAGMESLRQAARYTYDIRDLRIVTEKPDSTTWYQYDGNGNLIWKEGTGEVVKYVYALGQIWAEDRTVQGVDAKYFHHTDHLGSTELITDSSGKPIWSASYESFGAISSNNGEATFQPSYTGKDLDPDTGLYYFNARWYDPELGRFISEDPARDGSNWYSYCENNPLRYIDPTGLNEVPKEVLENRNKPSVDVNLVINPPPLKPEAPTFTNGDNNEKLNLPEPKTLYESKTEIKNACGETVIMNYIKAGVDTSEGNYNAVVSNTALQQDGSKILSVGPIKFFFGSSNKLGVLNANVGITDKGLSIGFASKAAAAEATFGIQMFGIGMKVSAEASALTAAAGAKITPTLIQAELGAFVGLKATLQGWPGK